MPKNAGRGGRWKSHRRVSNGILFRQHSQGFGVVATGFDKQAHASHGTATAAAVLLRLRS